MNNPARKISIVVVGLGFGAAFAPIYQCHPDVENVGICDPDEAKVTAIGDALQIPHEQRFTQLDEVLNHDGFDAIHLLTPVPLHTEHTLAVLNAGKHCACAVPMATELDDLRRILAAQQRSGKNYMMMETAVYTREFLFAQDLLVRGQFGALTFLRGTYFQDLEGSYPLYWRAQPPMHYATHAVAPLLALAQTRAASVCCLGSGRLRPDIQQPNGNQFPLQTAIFRLAGTNLAAEVTRSWFQTARAYTEAFSVYGEQQGFEWQQLEHEDPVLFTLEPGAPDRRGRNTTAARVHVPYRADLLPEAIAHFAEGDHGGSHPHLAHEFVRSIIEERPSAIHAAKAADWTAAGICAHESSLRDGERVLIRSFV
ncbi:MAG: Gfo/Idh/MocA family oxidoreductase [Herpetosiphonaceae bacterium]|nr:Gfo/Idh/MocA family oxidoreductase [Herpetosiphonaceae bacterium]